MAQAIDDIEQVYERSVRPNLRNAQSETFAGSAYDQELRSWNPLRAECRILIDEMRSRIPPERYPKDTYMDIPMAVDDGRLSGAYPLRNVEEYIRQFALELPQEQ